MASIGPCVAGHRSVLTESACLPCAMFTIFSLGSVRAACKRTPNGLAAALLSHKALCEVLCCRIEFIVASGALGQTQVRGVMRACVLYDPSLGAC